MAIISNMEVWFIVIQNTIPINKIEMIIKNNLIDGEFFYAEKWKVPILFFENKNSDDHQWHEFYNIEKTDYNFNADNIETLLDRIVVCI
jgi:spore germination protein GerM